MTIRDGLTGALRQGKDPVPVDFCGNTDLDSVNLISFDQFGSFRPLDEGIYGVDGTTRNEKAPVGAEDFFFTLLSLPGEINHLAVDGVTFVVF